MLQKSGSRRIGSTASASRLAFMQDHIHVKVEVHRLRRAKEWRRLKFLVMQNFEDGFEWKMIFRARRLHSLQLAFNRAAVHFPEPFIGFGNGFFAVPASLDLMKLGRGFGLGGGCTPPPVASR